MRTETTNNQTMQQILDAIYKTIQANSLTFFLLGFLAVLFLAEFLWDLVRNKG